MFSDKTQNCLTKIKIKHFFDLWINAYQIIFIHYPGNKQALSSICRNVHCLFGLTASFKNQFNYL